MYIMNSKAATGKNMKQKSTINKPIKAIKWNHKTCSLKQKKTRKNEKNNKNKSWSNFFKVL